MHVVECLEILSISVYVCHDPRVSLDFHRHPGDEGKIFPQPSDGKMFQFFIVETIVGIFLLKGEENPQNHWLDLPGWVL